MSRTELSRSRAGVLDDIQGWMDRRNAEVAMFGREAEAAAHEALRRAARSGQRLAATTSRDVMALGVHLLEKPKAQPRGTAPVRKAPVAPPRSQPIPPVSRAVVPVSPGRQIVDQIGAGARGAQDALTFGLGDRLYAGGRAIVDTIHGADLRAAYGARMAVEQARDQYDAASYRAARTTGQVLGTGAQIAALGPLEGLVLGGARIAQATPMVARELAVLGGVGSGVGVGAQALADQAHGRVSSVGDYVGSAVGGAVGGLAARGGRAGYAGAAGGAAASVAQDLANLRMPSVERARNAALVAGALGVVGGAAGRAWSDKLSNGTKEVLGEEASRLRTWAKGNRTAEGPKSREYLDGGGWTFPDQRTFRGLKPAELVESKFGRSARLSKRQTQAFHQPDLNYRVDHVLPRDIGSAVGTLLGISTAGDWVPSEGR